MPKRFLQGFWLGTVLVLWAVLIWHHFPQDPTISTALYTGDGGLIIIAGESSDNT